MKVLIINSVCGYGSTGKIVSDIYNVLKKDGHDVKVAYGFGKARGVNQDDLIRINNKFGYYCHNVLTRLTDRTGFYSHIQTKILIKKIKKFEPDVIHLHNLHGFYINIKDLFNYLSKSNIPIIWTLHDCWAMTGHCTHFSYEECNKWMEGCHNCPLKKEYPKSLFFDNSTKNFNQKKALFTSVNNMTIATPSDWLSNIVRSSYLSKFEVLTVRNGLDLDIFKPVKSSFREKNKISSDKKIILAVANVWSRRKGFDDLIELSKLINDNMMLVIVGVNQRSSYDSNNKILFIPRTNNVEELVEIYSASDVFVNPSYEETMGMVTVEALACGTPAVVYNKTAVPELIDENTGVVVEAGNIEGLYKAICKIDKKKYSTRKYMLKLNKKNVYDTYYELYCKVLNDNSNRK